MEELFPDGAHVRLRSREHGTYLHADEDGWGVSLSPHRASMNTAWAVHLLRRPQMDATYLLLHGVVGFLRMVQCDYNTPLQGEITWEVLRTEEDGDGHDNGVVVPVAVSRMIRYIRADDSGIFIMSSRGTLQFDGRSLHFLVGDLADILGGNSNSNNVTLCVRAGFYGRTTPLVVDLPLSEEALS